MYEQGDNNMFVTAYIEWLLDHKPLLSAEAFEYCHLIESFTPDRRKDLISLARCRAYVSRSSSLGVRITSRIGTRMFESVQDLFMTSDFQRAFLLVALHAAPFSTEQLSKMKKESLSKEISASTGPSVQSTLNWDALFGLNDKAVLPGLLVPIDRVMMVRKAMDQWLFSMAARVHYPRVSSKLVPAATLACLMDEDSTWTGSATYCDLMRRYILTGSKVKGASGVGVRFSPSNLTPRVFYPAGGAAYWKTVYTNSMMTALQEKFPNTAKRLRVTPERILGGTEYYAELYDLTSFTSTTNEAYRLLSAMARLALQRETRVRLFDPHLNKIRIAMLGHLLMETAQANTDQPFESEGCQHTSDESGLLGIPTNIQTCTLAHGLRIGLLFGFDETNCAGDDGLIRRRRADEDSVSLIEALGGLGVLQPEKVSSTLDGPGEHLKRSLVQKDDSFVKEPIYFLSSPEFARLSVDVDYLRFPDLAYLSVAQRRKAVSSSLVNLIYSLYMYEPDALEPFRRYVKAMYTKWGLPHEGRYPSLLEDRGGLVIAISWFDHAREDPILFTLDGRSGGMCSTLGYFPTESVSHDPLRLPSFQGTTIITHTRSLTLLSRCNLIEVTKRKVFLESVELMNALKEVAARVRSDILLGVSSEDDDERAELHEEEKFSYDYERLSARDRGVLVIADDEALPLEYQLSVEGTPDMDRLSLEEFLLEEP